MCAARVGDTTGDLLGLSGTEVDEGISLGHDLQGRECSGHRQMTGVLTLCSPEVKLTEQDERNCWTRREKNIGFNK